MATPLSAAHRTWRGRVFVATWLSYVAFYFCRRPFEAAKAAIGAEAGWTATELGNIWVSYLVAYAVGQFLASGMGDIGGRARATFSAAPRSRPCSAPGWCGETGAAARASEPPPPAPDVGVTA